MRSLRKGRALARALIGDEGEVAVPLFQTALSLLKKYHYSLLEGQEDDAPYQRHMAQVLEHFCQSPLLQRQLRQITRPFSNRAADEVIRHTLDLPPKVALTDAHARQAVLAAWLTLLRQNVGSCFATAPAIIIQREQPEQFLKDLDALLQIGQLKRVVDGAEYAVPMSSSWGSDDLRRPLWVDPEGDSWKGVCQSPGIYQALRAVGLVETEKEAQKYIESALQGLVRDNAPLIVVQAEQILKVIFLKIYDLQPKDLETFEESNAQIIAGPFVVQKTPQKKPLFDRCEKCLTDMYKAQEAFKKLTENALLRTWEFTLASFAESRPAFTRWNMYASLGFETQEPEGIADCLTRRVQELLDRQNRQVQRFQEDYEQAFHQLKYLEARMRSASTEKEVQWIRVEYTSRKNECLTLEELRDRAHYKAKALAESVTALLDAYDQLFPRYFQEVYDADMRDVSLGMYDDSPAGFRLLYKHGRTNPSQWTRIYTPQQFIDALAAFFVATERDLLTDPQFAALQEELVELITQLVTHVRQEPFLISALQRMAKAHGQAPIKDPLHHLEALDKKPWAYVSGGTMDNLIQGYFSRSERPFQEERWVENPLELVTFLVDAVKKMVPPWLDRSVEEGKALLMHSPTHAFTFHASLPAMKEAILSNAFSFTWVRDQLVQPADHFLQTIILEEEQVEWLLCEVKSLLPKALRPRFHQLQEQVRFASQPIHFRQMLAGLLAQDKGLAWHGIEVLSVEKIDGLLFSSLPFTAASEALSVAKALIEQLPLSKKTAVIEKAEQLLNSSYKPFFSSKELKQLVQQAIMEALQQTFLSFDAYAHIAYAAQKLGCAMPRPILFADTNWVKEWFAFVVNPGTGHLDLWRMNYTGSEGVPIHEWRQWLDGSHQKPTWGIYTKPQEYTT